MGKEGQSLKGMPALWGATHLMVPDRALFAALIRGETHVLAREYSATLEIPEGHGAGTDALVGLDKRMFPLKVFTVAISYIRSHRPQQQDKK